mgnify:CR=1 FL=1
MNQDTVTKLLRPGEQILWSSMSNPGKLMDEKNKQRNTRWFIIVGAVFAVLMFLYVRACIRAGTNVFSVVTLVFVLVAGIIFLDPVTTLKRLRKVEYAITTERVIVSSTSTNFSIPRSKAAPVQGYDKRSVSTPSGENNIFGAKDGFVEVVRTNMSLIRRRMKSPFLKLELGCYGDKSQTDLCICYLYDRVPQALIQKIKRQLGSMKLESILSSGYVRPFLETSRPSLFDTISTTQRPDVFCAKLLEGRVGILIDGTPFALMIPKLFNESFQSMDDYCYKPYYATFLRWLKYAAFLVALLLPALYVAIALHHPELLNRTLLLILAESEETAPLSLTTEAIGILLVYEIIREAGLRLPQAVGGAVSIVAGLIVGDAAVSSGLISTPMLTVTAISVIAGFVIPDLNPPISILRLAFVLVGGMGGLFGISLLGAAVLFHICAAQNHGFPLTAPVAPFRKRGMRDILYRADFPAMQSGNFTVEEYHE